MAVQVKNRVVKNVGTIPVVVAETDPSKRQTVIGLSITNLTNGFLTVSILLDDDTSVSGYYLKDALLASGTSLRAVSTGEKLILAPSNQMWVSCSLNDAVDVIISYVEIV